MVVWMHICFSLVSVVGICSAFRVCRVLHVCSMCDFYEV